MVLILLALLLTLLLKAYGFYFIQVYAKAKECSDQISVEEFAILLAKHFTLYYKQVDPHVSTCILNYTRASILTPMQVDFN